MQLTNVEIQNFQLIGHADLNIKTPLLLVAGSTEQGKTSFVEAIRLALTGMPTRVKLKKELGELIRDGNKKGGVSVSTATGRASYTLPKGEHATTIPADNVLPILLDPSLFARMPEEAKRELLHQICNINAKPADVLERLNKRGCEKERSTEVSTLILSGFPAAHTEAKEKMSGAKADWQATTGEKHGSSKAEGWKAPKPDVPEETLQADIDAAGQEISALVIKTNDKRVELGQVKQKIADATTAKTKFDQLTATAADLEHADELVTIAQAQYDEYLPQVESVRTKATGMIAGTKLACPHCQGEVEMLNGALVAYEEPEVKRDPEAVALLPEMEKGLKVLETALTNRKRDRDAALQAKTSLAEMGQPQSVGELGSERVEVETSIQKLESQITTQQTAQAEMQRLLKQSQDADEKTKKAEKHHTDFVEWSKIVDALAPEGIPGDLLAEAIKPFNERMRDTASTTGWKQISIDADMTIRADGRTYTLLSVSARMRADWAIAEALAHLSGNKLLVLDGIDVLLPSDRLVLIRWLDGLATAGEIETGIMIGSFVAPPKIPLDTVTVCWMENGELTPQQRELQAA